MAKTTEEKIREIAHKLWLDAGQPEGDDLAHWLKAEELATAKPKSRAPAKKTTAKAPAKARAKKAA